MVHQGEMIVPAAPAAAMRNAMNGGGAGAGGRGGDGAGGHTINVNFTANGRLSRSDILEHSRTIADAVRVALRDGHLRPSFP